LGKPVYTNKRKIRENKPSSLVFLTSRGQSCVGKLNHFSQRLNKLHAEETTRNELWIDYDARYFNGDVYIAAGVLTSYPP